MSLNESFIKYKISEKSENPLDLIFFDALFRNIVVQHFKKHVRKFIKRVTPLKWSILNNTNSLIAIVSESDPTSSKLTIKDWIIGIYCRNKIKKTTFSTNKDVIYIRGEDFYWTYDTIDNKRYFLYVLQNG